jgi:hypothetical protein
MVKLRVIYGIRYVFGIVTTMKEWKIVWLPDSSDAAGAENLDYPKNTEVDVDICEKRELCISKTYSVTKSLELSTCITSVLKKMHNGVGDRLILPLLDNIRTFIELSKQTWRWTTVTSPPKYTLYPPEETTDKFHLLRDYHGGSDGRVWLAAAVGSGRLAVIKFLCTEDAESQASLEANVWQTLGFSAYSCQLMGKFCVVMPYALHVKVYDGTPRLISSLNCWTSTDDILDNYKSKEIKFYQELIDQIEEANDSIQDILRNAVKFVSSKLVCHDDLEWRHVALIPKFAKNSEAKNSEDEIILNGYQATLIDLTRSRIVETAEEARNEMEAKMNNLLST